MLKNIGEFSIPLLEQDQEVGNFLLREKLVGRLVGLLAFHHLHFVNLQASLRGFNHEPDRLLDVM